MSKKTTPQADRLKRRSDFLRLRDSGRKWVSGTVIIQAGDGQGSGIRYGLTATKKLGNAVTRNRIKRRLREAVRAVLRDARREQAEKNADIVLIGRSAALDCDFAVLVKDIGWCLRKLEIVT